MARYAATTDVASDRSRAEIERTLRRYGATAFAYGWEGNMAQIGFKLAARQIKFRLPLPDPESREFKLTPTGRARSAASAEEASEQAVRQRWRALALVIKAKLEAVDAGISVIEDEFLSNIVMPDGRTVAETIKPGIAIAYKGGQTHNLLPDYSN